MNHERWTDSPSDPRRLIFARVNPWPRRIILACLVLVALAAIGCANEGWRKTHAPIANVRFIEAPGDIVQTICRNVAGSQYAIYYGCAERDYLHETCWIYTEPDPPAWLVEHERRHCAGESHD